MNKPVELYEPALWGASHTVAYALTSLDLDKVHRSTLRALLPSGRVCVQAAGTPREKRVNRMSMQFLRALRRFDRSEWIARSGEYIVVRDRAALLRWVAESPMPDTLQLSLPEAVEQIKRDLLAERAAEAVQQRRRELLALQRLMQSAPGAVTNERGTVRVVPRSRAI